MNGSLNLVYLLNFRNVIDVIDDRMLVFDPKACEDDFFFHGQKQQRRDLNKKANRDQKFAFDCVFGPNSTNEDVFEGTTKDLIDVIFNGYNCSVFVYGATGAGKTHTMLGSESNTGIIFRTVMELYDRIGQVSQDTECEVVISYLEVYNETIIDLINPGTKLDIREDGKMGVNIPGLSSHRPSGPDDLLRYDLFMYCNLNLNLFSIQTVAIWQWKSVPTSHRRQQRKFAISRSFPGVHQANQSRLWTKCGRQSRQIIHD